MEKGDRIELAEEKLSLEVKELFPYLESYQPKKKIINSNLKPFIPDYIPAIGNVESFLQVIYKANDIEKHNPISYLHLDSTT